MCEIVIFIWQLSHLQSCFYLLLLDTCIVLVNMLCSIIMLLNNFLLLSMCVVNVIFFKLQMDNVVIRGRKGTLHFIRFPTSQMDNFLTLAHSKGMANLVSTVCATGGGAYKFEENFKRVLVASTSGIITKLFKIPF